jgi:Amt family ammonium transporter
MLSTLSPVMAQQPTPEAPPVVEAPGTPPADAAAPPVDAAPVEPVVEEVVVEEEAPAIELTVDKGDTAWMLVSTILVLLMIVPGLALFYGGLGPLQEHAVDPDRF